MKMPLRRRIVTTLCAFGISVTLLPACSILPETEPVDLYLLPATTSAAAGSDIKPLDVSLRIARPASAPRLSGTHIAVVPQDNQFSVYSGARWSDPAPLLLRNRLLDAFRADGRITSLSSDEQNLHADVEISSELLAFQSEYRNGKPEVTIRLNAALVQTSSRRIVASRRFEVRQPVEGKQVPEVVRAFGIASDALASQVVAWTIGLASQPPARPRNDLAPAGSGSSELEPRAQPTHSSPAADLSQ